MVSKLGIEYNIRIILFFSTGHNATQVYHLASCTVAINTMMNTPFHLNIGTLLNMLYIVKIQIS